MPLTRATITVASRIMLPTYVIVFTWLGLNYVITPRARLAESPALRYTDTVIDLHALGGLLLAAAALIVIAIATSLRDVSRYALLLGVICFGLIVIVFLIATFNSQTSPSAAAWPFLGVCACYASYRSVTAREIT